MNKKITKAVCEQITVINNRIREILSGNTANNEKELMTLYQKYWNIRAEYDVLDRMFEENGKMGVVDVIGNVVVPALYKGFAEFHNRAIYSFLPIPACDFNDKYALVTSDGKGTPLCRFEYDKIIILRGSSNYFVCVKKVGERLQAGVIDSCGKVIVPCEMDKVYFVSKRIARVVKDGKMGVLTMNGDFFAPVYDEVEENNGYLAVCKRGRWGYLSSKGEFVDMAKEEGMDKANLLCLYEY